MTGPSTDSVLLHVSCDWERRQADTLCGKGKSILRRPGAGDKGGMLGLFFTFKTAPGNGENRGTHGSIKIRPGNRFADEMKSRVMPGSRPLGTCPCPSVASVLLCKTLDVMFCLAKNDGLLKQRDTITPHLQQGTKLCLASLARAGTDASSPPKTLIHRRSAVNRPYRRSQASVNTRALPPPLCRVSP